MYNLALSYNLDSKTGEIRGMVGMHMDNCFLGWKTAWIEETTVEETKKFPQPPNIAANYVTALKKHSQA